MRLMNQPKDITYQAFCLQKKSENNILLGRKISIHRILSIYSAFPPGGLSFHVDSMLEHQSQVPSNVQLHIFGTDIICN